MTWTYQPFPVEAAAPADDTPGGSCMSLDVCVEGLAQPVEYYATDDIQGTQCAPLEDAPPEATIVNTSFPDYIVDELFEPGVFWFQTGPPTSLDDETGQTRGDTLVPEYLEPDDQLDPSDQDWQNPTTALDATCAAPYIIGSAGTTSVGATSHNINLPAASVGDAYLVLISTQAEETFTGFPAGWQVALNTLTTVNSPNDNNGVVLYRVVDGTEGSSITVTTSLSSDIGALVYTIGNPQPFSGVHAVGTPVEFADAPALTSPWGTSPALYVVAQFIAGNEAPTTFPANMPMGRRYVGATGSGGVAAAAAQSSAGSFNPQQFSNPTLDSWVAVVAVRGYCIDDLNDDPAGCSVPSNLEPEVEVDCYGFQSQGPGDDPNVVFDDPDTGHTSVPDWLEPDAEPNPDDVTFGWQRQSLLEEDYQPGEAWTAVTEPQENVFDYSTDWWIQAATIDEPALDVDDETTISVCWPEWLEPEAEFDPSDQDWQHRDQPDAERCVAPFIVESVQTADSGIATTSHTVNLPASPRPGSLLIVILGGDYSGVSPTYPAGWTEIDYGATSSWTGAIYAAYRLADGTEGASITVTTAVAGILQATSFEIDNWDSASVPASARGTSSGANPGTEPLTSGFGLEPTLWINALGFVDLDTVSSYPTGFDYFQSDQKGTDNRSLAIAARQQTIATQPANSFTMTGSTGESYNIHIAIKGACLEEKVYSSIPDWLEPEDTYPDTWLSWPREDQGVDFEAVDTSIPANLEPEAQVDTEGWRCAPLEDLPTNPEIVGRSVPDDMEPEPEPDTNGWQSEPLHDTPSTDDITGTSVPVELLPEDEVDCDGWAFRLPDMDAAPVVIETPDPGTAVGTLPGHWGKRPRWWLEDVAKDEKAKRARGEGVWPNLPEPKQAPPWNPKTLTTKSARPRLSQINRDWKIKMRKVRQADDALIAAIIAALLTEKPDGKPD